MKSTAFICLALVGLSACGGSQPTYDDLNASTTLIATDNTTPSSASQVARGGAHILALFMAA